VAARDLLASALALALALAAGAGCSLRRDGLAREDAGQLADAGADAETADARIDGGADAGLEDAGPIDAGSDAGSDAGLDAGPPDAGPPDAGPRDGGPPDGGPPDAPMRPPLCVSDPALVGCWPLDGDALDSSPRGNDLAATAVTFPPTGGALLGPTSGLVRAPRPQLRHSTVSFDVWVRLDALPAAGRIGIADQPGQFGIFVGPGGEVRCAAGLLGVGFISVGGALGAGTWHHVACGDDGAGNLALYVDGVLRIASASTVLAAPADEPLQLGENAPTGDEQLVGAMDDARLWDRARTAAEIASDFARGRVIE
jgi:hypothetical protein